MVAAMITRPRHDSKSSTQIFTHETRLTMLLCGDMDFDGQTASIENAMTTIRSLAAERRERYLLPTE